MWQASRYQQFHGTWHDLLFYNIIVLSFYKWPRSLYPIMNILRLHHVSILNLKLLYTKNIHAFKIHIKQRIHFVQCAEKTCEGLEAYTVRLGWLKRAKQYLTVWLLQLPNLSSRKIDDILSLCRWFPIEIESMRDDLRLRSVRLALRAIRASILSSFDESWIWIFQVASDLEFGSAA